MRERLWVRLVGCLVFLLPLSAAGQTCGNVKEGEDLKNPPEIVAKGDGLSTELDVRFQTFCIPSTKNSDGTWTTTPLKLRTYISPARPAYPEDRPRPATDLTGPTLRLRKASDPAGKGQFLSVLLKNSLPYGDGTTCNSACAAGTACDCSPAALDALIKKCAPGQPPAPECCCVVNCTQKAPNCLHGDNVTNLHFHGSHASPQSPQDFSLLDLYPNRPANAPAVEHGTHGEHGSVAYGQFQYRVDPFNWRQPEGTHWYHPHKHGSVGKQVANGMAGALVIEGPFDDWLRPYYTSEKLMVIQSVTSDEPLFQRGSPTPQTLVNGQIKPTIKMAPGEIQRWRIVNATMSSRTLLELTMPAGVTFRQIAMDGVRFSDVNYKCQPLLNFNANKPAFPCNPSPGGNPTIRIAPGNRADFLVQAPLVETKKGTEGLRIERKVVEIAGEEREGNRKLLRAHEEAMAPGPPEPALFTMIVDDGVAGNDDQPKRLKAGAPAFPANLPPMPDYLRNIETAELDGKPVSMTFQQFLADRPQQWPYSQSPLSSFKIDNRQFDSKCANVTTVLGTASEWTVSNATLLPHPFHIHTNPFQVISVKGVPVRTGTKTPEPEPFWLDTLTLPVATVSPSAPPADPSTPITITPVSFVMRQRYLEFTGQYVLHCHFLGHEDRGMMFSVQTVCSDKHPNSAGKYGRTALQPDECLGPGQFPDALPPCK